MIFGVVSHRRALSTLGLGVLILAVPLVSGQIVEDREYHGKKIMCVLSGLRDWGSPCGTDGNYDYIFVGSVGSAAEISDTEKRLQVTPEEIFRGDATNSLTVTTNQGA